MKVFIADNSLLFRRHLIEMLSELEGVEIVGQAGNAEDALAAITLRPPDVVTLDVSILGGSGIDVLTKIKKRHLAPVVIMLTNQSSLPYRKKCEQAGADFFIDKAIEISEVRQIIEGLRSRFNAQLKGRNVSFLLTED
jgi:DNA-binding NarL/FixJ family response regulator